MNHPAVMTGLMGCQIIFLVNNGKPQLRFLVFKLQGSGQPHNSTAYNDDVVFQNLFLLVPG